MKKLVGGNFKLNMSTKASIDAYYNDFVSNYDENIDVDVVLAPQMGVLETRCNKKLPRNVSIAAQNVASEVSGAFTGETSVAVLQDLGVRYVIVGHSERRQYYNETDVSVNKKIKRAIEYGIRPIVCVGETLEQKEANQTLSVLSRQLEVALQDVDKGTFDIAYEPVWAIGTGKVPLPDDIHRAHLHIRSFLGPSQTRIIYGGSVKDTNAPELIRIPHVDGFLVGGASLDPKIFRAIINAVASAS